MFFPDPLFGWTFYLVLMGFLAVASYIDVKWIKIPRKLTVVMLGVGIVFNVARGMWLGSDPERTVWVFSEAGVGLGAIDGLLFALAGFAASLAMFLAFWIFGMVGGGDVKLFAAVGAWVGPVNFLFVLFGTGAAMILLTALTLIGRMVKAGPMRAFYVNRNPQKNNAKKAQGPRAKAGSLMTYALPVCLSTAVVVPMLFHKDMGLRPPVTEETNTQTAADL